MKALQKHLNKNDINLHDIVTYDNVKHWHETQDKFIFCLDLLELGLINDMGLCKADYCDKIVGQLEDIFENSKGSYLCQYSN